METAVKPFATRPFDCGEFLSYVRTTDGDRIADVLAELFSAEPESMKAPWTARRRILLRVSGRRLEETAASEAAFLAAPCNS